MDKRTVLIVVGIAFGAAFVNDWVLKPIANAAISKFSKTPTPAPVAASVVIPVVTA